MDQHPNEDPMDVNDGEITPKYDLLAQRTKALIEQSAATKTRSGTLLSLLNPDDHLPQAVISNEEMDSLFDFVGASHGVPVASQTPNPPGADLNPGYGDQTADEQDSEAFEREPTPEAKLIQPAAPEQTILTMSQRAEGSNDTPSASGRYKCTEVGCERTFGRWASRRDHISGIHRHEFDCTACPCPVQFSSIQSLEAHLWTVHNERWHLICALCSRAFANEARLANHAENSMHLLNEKRAAETSEY